MTEVEYYNKFLFWNKHMPCRLEQEIDLETQVSSRNKLIWPVCFAFSVSDIINAENFVYVFTQLLTVWAAHAILCMILFLVHTYYNPTKVL